MRYLGFTVGGERFCIPVSLVVEILDEPEYSLLPASPPYVRGMINLRGKIVPLFDLHERFGLPSPDGRGSVIVIESMRFDLGLLGLMVDVPEEVFDVDEFEEIPSYSDSVPAECVEGVAQRDGETYILLRTDTVIDPEHEFPDTPERE